MKNYFKPTFKLIIGWILIISGIIICAHFIPSLYYYVAMLSLFFGYYLLGVDSSDKSANIVKQKIDEKIEDNEKEEI